MWVKFSFLICVFFLACGSQESNYIDQLKTGTPKQRAQAAAFLGAQRVPEAIPALRDALHDENIDVKTKAIWALGMLRSKDALPDLLFLMKNSDRNIRQVTVRAVMQIEEPEAIPVLEKALKIESDEWVRKDIQTAIEHLRQFEGEADIGEASVRGEFF